MGYNEVNLKQFVAIPYIKGLSDNIKRILKGVKLNSLYTILKKLDCIIKRGKDLLDTMKQTQLVYKIECGQCVAVYIGQTKRHVSTRIKEHQRDITKDVSNHSVISKHRVSCGHEFKWSQPIILHKECVTRKREIAEMYFIKKHEHTINLQRDTENMTAIYDKVIKAV